MFFRSSTKTLRCWRIYNLQITVKLKRIIWNASSQLACFCCACGVPCRCAPGEEHNHVSAADLALREMEATALSLQARKRPSAIAAFEAERIMKRDTLMKRQTTTSTAAPPHYTSIQNSTCITAPEVTEGPHYINNEYVRTDLTETQNGVKLVLDVGVINTTTCKPLPNVFVELWAANATGVYGGYHAGGATLTPQGNVPAWRLLYQCKRNRRNHHHLIFWVLPSVVHIGQFFFAETWNDKVFATSPYNTNKQTRTLNSQDSILTQGNSGGNNAFVNLQQLGHLSPRGCLATSLSVSIPASLTRSRTKARYRFQLADQSLYGSIGWSMNFIM
ncbi:putative aromatic compound dioxygenase [Lyophyllum shimeji]|uniref:Aromatic compound dioxygenase n=1 Tax=Lyophyllum shimeji TaxID=47721 RepID=A0A9P3UMV5_LYOSH|nr:putative aromatic compound dioxygenase [Lyophyllum shimeji]